MASARSPSRDTDIYILSPQQQQQGSWSDLIWSWGCAACPGHGDSWASLPLWGSGCLLEYSNDLNIASSLGKMLRLLVWGIGSGHRETYQCCGNTQQRVFLPLAIAVWMSVRLTQTAFWHSWKCCSSSVIRNSSLGHRLSPDVGHHCEWGSGSALWRGIRVRYSPGQDHVWCFSRYSSG